MKTGLLFTNTILHNKVLYIASALFLIITLLRVFYLKEKDVWKNISWQWSCAALIAGFVCLNQQILTGKTVWPGHFVQYTIPLSYIVFFTSIACFFDELIVKNFASKYEIFRRGLFYVVLASVSIIFVVNVITVRSVYQNLGLYTDSQRYIHALEWLQKYAGETCVVFPLENEDRFEKYIPAYTQCDLYSSAYVFFNVPKERILDNFIIWLRLLGITQEDLPGYLRDHPAYIRRYFFEDWVDMFYNPNDTWVFNSKDVQSRESFISRYTDVIMKEYARTLSEPVDTLLKRHKIDYIMVDTRYNQAPNVPGFRKIFEENHILIFQKI
jgi:hypothetical protein